MVAAAAITDSLTHAVVRGAVDLVGPLTNAEIEQAIRSGALVFSLNAQRQVQVEYGINTLVTLSADQDAGWRKIRRVRTRYNLMDRIVAVVSDNVVGTLKTFTVNTDGVRHPEWRATDMDVPDNSAVGLGDSSKARGQVFVSSQGFLTPPTLSLAEVETGAIAPLKSAPAKFDASTHVVEQFEATSSDGTKIPYFVTRPSAMDGPAPTILFGYGGFQVSFPPAYKPEMGKLWLENGGVFVQANIRGGGEFGPAWHQAALNENRQLAFDDFTAVARDLRRRGITSPDKLGIMAGQRRGADGQHAHAPSGALWRDRERGGAARHAALHAAVGRRLSQRPDGGEGGGTAGAAAAGRLSRHGGGGL